MNKNSKYYPPSVVIIVFSAFASVIWVLYSVYQSFYSPVPPVIDETLLTPVDPVLNTQQFDQIKQSIFLNDEEIGDTLVLTPLEPLEKPIESSESSELLNINE